MILADPARRRATYAGLSESLAETRPLSHLLSDRAKLAESFSTAQKFTRLRLGVGERRPAVWPLS